jgi:hypothetical protein
LDDVHRLALVARDGGGEADERRKAPPIEALDVDRAYRRHTH